MTTLPDGCFDIGDDDLEDLSEGKRPDLGEDTISYEENAHKQLMNDPKYAVHVHESQLKRIVEVIEEVSQRLVALEDKFIDLELSVRFKETMSNDGPPEPPTLSV